MHDAQLRYPLRESIEHRPRVVLRPVIDGDELEVRVVGQREHAERLLELALLVVTGNQDGYTGVRRKLRRRLRPRLVSLAHEAIQQPAGHPVPGHYEGIAKAE